MTTPHPAAVSAARSRALEHFRRGSADMDADIAIIHRHFAPVLEEKDNRIAELEAKLKEANADLSSYAATSTEEINHDLAGDAACSLQMLIRARERIAELEAACAAKDAALKQLLSRHPTEGAWDSCCSLCNTRTEVGTIPHKADCPYSMATAALSPTCSAGWLSPQEATWMRAEHAKQMTNICEDVLQGKCQAQIRALRWAYDASELALADQPSAIEDRFATKLAALKAGGPLL